MPSTSRPSARPRCARRECAAPTACRSPSWTARPSARGTKTGSLTTHCATWPRPPAPPTSCWCSMATSRCCRAAGSRQRRCSARCRSPRRKRWSCCPRSALRPARRRGSSRCSPMAAVTSPPPAARRPCRRMRSSAARRCYYAAGAKPAARPSSAWPPSRAGSTGRACSAPTMPAGAPLSRRTRCNTPSAGSRTCSCLGLT
mmetsp:Transcript_19396/g.60310  ORF Transcript_19396/g.60310 Transcript_19396/m.60310 type:complete len:201 (-) Transcript_19396:622-1224(-)